jgi:hypothetical protein
LRYISIFTKKKELKIANIFSRLFFFFFRKGVRHMSIGEEAEIKVRYDHAYSSFAMGADVPPRANISFQVANAIHSHLNIYIHTYI